MSELHTLIEAARAAQNAGEALALATVVQVEGSAYRQPGARMLFSESRWLAGSVSGGCLERDILARGFWRTRDTGAALLSYDSASDERRGTGCEGVVHVLLQRLVPGRESWPSLLEGCVKNERGFVLATLVRARDRQLRMGESLSLFADGRVSSECTHEMLRTHALGAARRFAARRDRRVSCQLAVSHGLELFVEAMEPPPHLFIFGSAHDAVALVALAKALGWSVSVCTGDVRAATRSRFHAADRVLVGAVSAQVAELDRCARPLAVVMGHHYESDLAALRALLPSRALYIGLLGAQKRAARLLEDVASAGRGELNLKGRLHAPVGLQIGAEGPAEIALSILAEAQAVLSGCDAQKRSLQRPFFARAPEGALRRDDSGLHALPMLTRA